MYVHPIRPDSNVKLVPVDLPVVPPRVAVLLNANAKRVDEKVRRSLAHVVPEGDLFLTRSFEEARAVAETVVDRRYQMVFTGGGDGTFVGFLNEIINAMEKRRAGSPFAGARLPQFGILKLGTGNALAGLCHSSSLRGDGIVDDVLRARAGQVPGYRQLDLMVAEGKRTPFAGVGVDAGILNYFIEIKRSMAGKPFGKLFGGGLGYALAIGGRAIPTYTLKQRPNIEVRTRGSAFRIGPDGRPQGEALAPGSVLYQGPALLAAASTVPYYGYNFKLFPFAGIRRGTMHLRVANPPVQEIIPNIYPAIWNGVWRHPDVHDFLVEDVEMRLDRKAPFQIGGDAEGYRDYVRFTTWKHSVELLDFSVNA